MIFFLIDLDIMLCMQIWITLKISNKLKYPDDTHRSF